MMRSLFSGISGLRAHQTRMDVVGNNIANVNTTGFKASAVNFQDMLSQTLQGASSGQGGVGGTNPMQVGLGVKVASIQTFFSDGSVQPTGNPLDMAISGNGFFVFSDGMNQFYSRAGNLDLDVSGNLVSLANGYKVMGYMADSAGNINSNQDPENIVIPMGQTMGAKPTTELTLAKNLKADAPVGTTISTSKPAFDSLGNSHTVNEVFYKTGENTWLVSTSVQGYDGTLTNRVKEIAFTTSGELKSISDVTIPTAAFNYSIPDLGLDDVAGGGGTYTLEVIDEGLMKHELTFEFSNGTGSGQWDYVVKENGKTIYPAPGALPPLPFMNLTGGSATFPLNNTTFTFAFPTIGGTPATPAAIDADQHLQSQLGALGGGGASGPFSFNPPGADPISINLNVKGLTQYGGETTVLATEQNGYAAGSLKSISADQSGTILGVFTNGQIRKLAQVALAAFNNPSGLTKMGDNLYIESNNSGSPQVGAANTGGRGTLTPSALEMSNVDLAQEFSNMIITQRGFQANSKIITTTDEMLQELANLKR